MKNLDMYKDAFDFRKWIYGENNKVDALWCITELRDKYGSKEAYEFLRKYCIDRSESLEITAKSINGDWMHELCRSLEIQRIGGEKMKCGFIW